MGKYDHIEIWQSLKKKEGAFASLFSSGFPKLKINDTPGSFKSKA